MAILVTKEGFNAYIASRYRIMDSHWNPTFSSKSD